MTIHLPEPQQGDDLRNYPWRRLIRAVRRACNLRVAAPLEMTTGPYGTIISLAPPQRTLWQASVSTTLYPMEDDHTQPGAVVQFDTLDVSVSSPRGFGIFSSGVLEILTTGIVRSVVALQLSGYTPTDTLSSVTAWLELSIDAGTTWTQIPLSAGNVVLNHEAYGVYYNRLILDQLLKVTRGDMLRVKAIRSNGPGDARLIGNDGDPIFDTAPIAATSIWNLAYAAH